MRRAIARGRVFPQSYSTDRRYGRLSLKACALFPLMWANADDQGRLCGDPEEVKYAVCPNIDHITKADIPGLLSELEQNKLIRLYDTPKSSVIQILDWWDIQKPQWAWPSQYPALDSWKDRLRYKRGTKEVVTQNWQSGETPNGAQVSDETTSGENERTTHLTPLNVSGESKNHIQVSSAINKTRQEKILTASGPLPPPPLETEKERGIRKRKEERGNSPENSGENQKGAQVNTIHVAKKPPAPFAEEKKKIFEALKERRGYNSPQSGAEAQAITWMLKQGYSVEQILSTYDTLKQDVFWRNKLLNMQSVKAQIGEIVKERRQCEQRESRKERASEHRQDTQPSGKPYDWQEAPAEPDDTS